MPFMWVREMIVGRLVSRRQVGVQEINTCPTGVPSICPSSRDRPLSIQGRRRELLKRLLQLELGYDLVVDVAVLSFRHRDPGTRISQSTLHSLRDKSDNAEFRVPLCGEKAVASFGV